MRELVHRHESPAAVPNPADPRVRPEPGPVLPPGEGRHPEAGCAQAEAAGVQGALSQLLRAQPGLQRPQPRRRVEAEQALQGARRQPQPGRKVPGRGGHGGRQTHDAGEIIMRT